MKPIGLTAMLAILAIGACVAASQFPGAQFGENSLLAQSQEPAIGTEHFDEIGGAEVRVGGDPGQAAIIENLARVLVRCSGDGESVQEGQFEFFFPPDADSPKVSVNLQSSSIRDAISALFDGSAVAYFIEDDVTSDARLSMRVDNVKLTTALAFVTEAGGVGWRHEQRAGNSRYRIGKSVWPGVMGAPTTAIGSDDEIIDFDWHQDCLGDDAAEAAEVKILSVVKGSGKDGPQVRELLKTLPRANAVRIDVDVADGDVREAVRQVCRAAKMECWIDDDVPVNFRVTLQAKNVRLSTTLDLITQTADVGWRYELRNGKGVVHVGKTVRRGLSVRALGGTGQPFQWGPGTHRKQFDLKELRFGVPGEGGWSWNGGRSAARVDLDIRELGVKEALKRVLEQVKVEYAINDDVPDQPRVTVSAKNVRLSTALDLLTQCGGVGWTYERSSSGWRYRIGKTVSRGLFPNVLGAGAPFRVDVNKFGSDTEFPYVITAPAQGSAYTLRFDERRSSFTCPHCKAKITMVRTQETRDGISKASPEWKFCPVCGKRIELQRSGSK